MKIPILHKCETAIRIRLQEFLGRYLLRKHFLSRAFFRAMGASGTLIVGNFDDHKLAFRPGENIGDNLLFKGEWQREEIKRVLSFATRSNSFPRAAVFVDVGANNGTHTVYAMRSGRFVRALSIEPEPENFRLLRLNLRLKVLGRIARSAGPAEHRRTLVLPPGDQPNFISLYVRAQSIRSALVLLGQQI